ncbi:FAD-dependent oxidoreductase, partial [Cupriavidus sp. 2MCAB6]
MNAALPAPMGLPALEQRLRQDLEWLEWPAKDWVPQRAFNGQRVRDVVVIGAGMCGLAASAALKGLG